MAPTLVMLLLSHAALGSDPQPAPRPAAAHTAAVAPKSTRVQGTRSDGRSSSAAAANTQTAHGHGDASYDGHRHHGWRGYPPVDPYSPEGRMVIYGEGDEVTGSLDQPAPPTEAAPEQADSAPEQATPPADDPQPRSPPPAPHRAAPAPKPRDITIEDDENEGSGSGIYRWVDADGSVHYSDGDMVPQTVKKNAVKTSGDPIMVTHPTDEEKN